MGWFSRKPKRVPLELQLQQLAELGFVPNEGVGEEDLITIDDRETLEARPYVGLVEALAMQLEREPFPPKCDRLWMCDFECIEDHGDYVRVLERFECMTGRVLGLTELEDRVDLEGGEAWLRFKFRGDVRTWKLEVEDDWLDVDLPGYYDALLAEARAPIRLFVAGAAEDYGQSSLFVGLEPKQVARFTKLTGLRMLPLSA